MFVIRQVSGVALEFSRVIQFCSLSFYQFEHCCLLLILPPLSSSLCCWVREDTPKILLACLHVLNWDESIWTHFHSSLIFVSDVFYYHLMAGGLAAFSEQWALKCHCNFFFWRKTRYMSGLLHTDVSVLLRGGIY